MYYAFVMYILFYLHYIVYILLYLSVLFVKIGYFVLDTYTVFIHDSKYDSIYCGFQYQR